jgi:pimeloyl-ACP methyl ester carboxylesterase
MSLTGPLFLNAVLVVTAAAFVLVVVVWPRLTPRTPWHVAGRVGALLLVNLLVLLSAVTQLNAAYLFFADWTDLQGALSGHVAQTGLDRGGAASKALRTPASGQAAHASRKVPALTVPVSASGVAQFKVTGPLSGLSGTVVVQLPEGYTSAAAQRRRYPVLEAYHGYPSGPLTWVKIFHIGDAIRQQVQARALRPTLVVIPQIEIPAGVDTEGVNGAPGLPQVETWLTRDVPDWVARTFRVESNRDSWATIGYSAGGWVAAMSTILHPAQYGAAIVLGGYFKPQFGPFYNPYPPTSPLVRRYDLPEVVKARPPPVALWMETSHSDALSYTSSAAFLRAAHRPLAVHAVVLQNAGHRDSVWINLLPEALRWLGANVRGFGP